jgi:hypothetical protein
MLRTTGTLRPKPITRPLTTSALNNFEDLSARVDQKGKVFTERMRTVPVEVQLLTTQGYMQGFVHVHPGQRVKDLLNDRDEQFLAVTNAIFDAGDNGEAQDEIAFIAINKDYIISAVPLDEDRPVPTEEDYIAF